MVTPDRASPRSGRRLGLSSASAGVLVFVSSGAVLVLELSALRLLAPYLGLTLQMSSAVIGVALGAIAFGTWVGGRAADVIDPERALGPVMVAGGLLTWLVLPAVRVTGEALRGGDQSVVLLVAMLTLFLPAAVLSALTPMVVRLELRSLDRTGSVVGRLSAIGTLGALLATFVTGFVLFAVVPTSRIIIVLGAGLVLLGVALMIRRRQHRVGIASVALAGAAVGTLVVLAPEPCSVETRYHCADVVADPDNPSGRVLVLDTLRHSYVDVDDAANLAFGYVRAMAASVEATHADDEPLRVLHLGGGGMTLPRYWAQVRPGSTSTVLEIDPGVVRLVRDRIAIDPPGVDLRIVDARVGLHDEPDRAYDVVIGDAFSSIAVPWHLATAQAMEEVRRTMAPGGLAALNVIDQPPLALMRAVTATVSATFDHVAVLGTPATLAGREGGNAVVLASDEPLPLSLIDAELAEADPDQRMLAGEALDRFIGSARVLTDDLAPVDQLLTPYASR